MIHLSLRAEILPTSPAASNQVRARVAAVVDRIRYLPFKAGRNVGFGAGRYSLDEIATSLIRVVFRRVHMAFAWHARAVEAVVAIARIGVGGDPVDMLHQEKDRGLDCVAIRGRILGPSIIDGQAGRADAETLIAVAELAALGGGVVAAATFTPIET